MKVTLSCIDCIYPKDKGEHIFTATMLAVCDNGMEWKIPLSVNDAVYRYNELFTKIESISSLEDFYEAISYYIRSLNHNENIRWLEFRLHVNAHNCEVDYAPFISAYIDGIRQFKQILVQIEDAEKAARNKALLEDAESQTNILKNIIARTNISGFEVRRGYNSSWTGYVEVEPGVWKESQMLIEYFHTERKLSVKWARPNPNSSYASAGINNSIISKLTSSIKGEIDRIKKLYEIEQINNIIKEYMESAGWEWYNNNGIMKWVKNNYTVILTGNLINSKPEISSISTTIEGIESGVVVDADDENIKNIILSKLV